jgi:hypothetical protein
MQESGPGLVKASQILSLTHAVSEFPTTKIDIAGSVPASTREGAGEDGTHLL